MHLIHSIPSWFSTWNANTIVAVANMFIALGTIVLAAGIPLSMRFTRLEQRNTYYATLDRTYFDIQRAIIDNPHLARPALDGKTPEQVVQYDAFAFMTWNFVETIYDYAIDGDDPQLRKTWECVVMYEAKLHGAWFKELRNQPKFKKSFRDWIAREHCMPEECAPPDKAVQANPPAAPEADKK